MQYTPNYNLITVEGTDVVNPLVQMNPNFTDIDAAMFANKQASIGTATEVAAGAVHAITRANPDSNYFKFTATSNWTAGDSMTVDGVAVSVFLTDGTLPSTGAYVINTEVFGIISGTRVTLYLASAPVSSLDADQITFDPAGTTLNPLDTDVDKAIKELASNAIKGSVTITADGIKKFDALFTDVYNAIDGSKVTASSKFVIDDGTNATVFGLFSYGPAGNPTTYKFITSWCDTTAMEMTAAVIRPVSPLYLYKKEGTAGVNNSGVTAPIGMTFTVIY